MPLTVRLSWRMRMPRWRPERLGSAILPYPRLVFPRTSHISSLSRIISPPSSRYQDTHPLYMHPDLDFSKASVRRRHHSFLNYQVDGKMTVAGPC